MERTGGSVRHDADLCGWYPADMERDEAGAAIDAVAIVGFVGEMAELDVVEDQGDFSFGDDDELVFFGREGLDEFADGIRLHL